MLVQGCTNLVVVDFTTLQSTHRLTDSTHETEKNLPQALREDVLVDGVMPFR